MITTTEKMGELNCRRRKRTSSAPHARDATNAWSSVLRKRYPSRTAELTSIKTDAPAAAPASQYAGSMRSSSGPDSPELAPDEHHERGDESYETPYDHDEGVMQIVGLGDLSEIHGTSI